MASEPGQPTFRRGRVEPDRPRGSYLFVSTRPLHVLLFLLPLVVFYEIGSAVYLAGDSGLGEELRARRILSTLFDAFGMQGLYIPGILLVAILLIWHGLTRDPWRVRPGVLVGMLAEVAAWTVPLLVLGQLLSRMLLDHHAPPAAATGFEGFGTGARLTIAIGAGLYEELLFRMLGSALVHALLVDLLGVRDRAGQVAAVVATAIAFALYHDAQSLPEQAYFGAAGLAFGALYAVRGFGIVVGVHALYDVVVLLMPASA